MFCYANRTAQGLWVLTWDEFIRLPSRLSAEPLIQAERDRLLARVRTHGFIDDYQVCGSRRTAGASASRARWCGWWCLKARDAWAGGAVPGLGARLSRRLAPFKRRRARATLNSERSTLNKTAGWTSGSRQAHKSPTVLIGVGWTRNAGPTGRIVDDDQLANRDYRATPPAPGARTAEYRRTPVIE